MEPFNRQYERQMENEPVLLVEMRVKGYLKEWFGDYFGGLQLKFNEDGSCTLTGKLQDSAAFYGLILTLRDSGVELLSLEAKKRA